MGFFRLREIHKCLCCGTFDKKSNHFGPVIAKKLKKFRKIG